MARKSTKKPASIRRGHTLPSVNPTFEELDKLSLTQLREYAKNVDVNRPKLAREALLRCICAVKNIRHPNDGTPSPIPAPPPSPTPLSVAANGPTSLAQTPVAEATAPTLGVVPKDSVDRANVPDTRRLSRPPDNEDDINAKYIDEAGFSRSAPDNTPEPDAQAPLADAESLEQTVKMLQAFRKRNDELAQQVKEITNTAQALKKTAADLMQSVIAQRASRVRMEVYLKYYKQEQPTFAHKVAFPPDDPVFVSVDEERQSITDEMDATHEDQEEDFAIYKAAEMLRRAKKGKKPDPNRYDEEDDNDHRYNELDAHKAFYWSTTSRGLSEAEKESFAQSRLISEDPETRRRLYAAYPDLKPKNLKRPASFRNSCNTETGESSTAAFVIPNQTDDSSVSPRQNKRPKFNPPASPTNGTPQSRRTNHFLDPNSVLPPRGTQRASEARPEVVIAPPLDPESRQRRQVSYSDLSVRPPQQGSSQQSRVAPPASRPDIL